MPVSDLHQDSEKCDHCNKTLTDDRLNIDLQGFHHIPFEQGFSIDCNGLSFCNMKCFIRYLESEKYVN